LVFLHSEHCEISYHTGHCYLMYTYHRYTDTITRYIMISYSCPTDTRIHQFTEYHHFICCYHHYMDTRYTVIPCLYITVTHACMVSIFLSYGSPFILHVLLLHVYSCIPVTWLFPVTSIDILLIDILVTGHECCWYAMCGTKCHVDLSHGGHL